MPRIAELKEIDGALWARLDLDLKDGGSVSLFTEAEVQGVRADERKGCVWSIQNCSLLSDEEKNIAVQAIEGWTIS